MGTVVFDFDSTLIRVESLEKILEQRLAGDPEKMARIQAVTDAGMEGRLTFSESLAQRLAIASPSLAEVEAFGREAVSFLTAGMADLCAWLSTRGVALRIVSGGLKQAIVPLAVQLGIAAEDVHAVSLRFEDSGAFAGIDEQDPFSHGKIEGVRARYREWPGPRIAVGDGMTDFALFESGLVDHFVLYTEHVCRQAPAAKAAYHAASADELKQQLEAWL